MKKQNKLVQLLMRRGKLTARECCQYFGVRATESNKRVIRQMAEDSEGIVVSGQEGYSLVNKDHGMALDCIRSLMNQSNKMKARAKMIAAHIGVRV